MSNDVTQPSWHREALSLLPDFSHQSRQIEHEEQRLPLISDVIGAGAAGMLSRRDGTVTPRAEGALTPRPGGLTPRQGALTPRQDHSPRLPFSMPNMEPLARQQGLLFEQSELLREQFMKFAESLQRLHSTLEEVREDLQFEKQQRFNGEETTAGILASVRNEVASVRNEAEHACIRQDKSQQQLEDRLLSLREEVALRTKAAEGEAQRLAVRLDGFQQEATGQLAGLSEDQRVLSDFFKTSVLNLQDEMRRDRMNQTADIDKVQKEMLMTINDNIREEALARSEALRSLQSQLEQRDSQRLSSEQKMNAAIQEDRAALEQSLDSSRRALSDQISSAQEAAAADLADVAARIGEELRAAEYKQNNALQGCADSAAASLTEEVSVLQAAISDKILGVQSEAACEAERMSSQFAALGTESQRLGAELEAERQQSRIHTLGMMTELSEMREALGKETLAHQESKASLSHWAKETAALQQSFQLEEAAQAAIGDAWSQHHSALVSETAQLRITLEQQLAKGLAESNEDFKMGREELWHVFGALQDSTAQASDELKELERRTQQVEVERLGQVAQRLDELLSLNSHVNTKVQSLEKVSMQEQVALTTKLDGYAHELEQTKSSVNRLIESPSRDFLESANQQWRFYLTESGDIAVFRRNGWGKYGNDFQGVPRWHAGIVGDKPICSVNREMQGHERDRFLAVANRAEHPG